MEEHQVNICVNGQPQVPPGFRFHPTEEELLRYYLRKKIASEKIDLDVIREVDLNKLEPWDIQENCKIGSGVQTEWYLFSHKDKKYPTGTRTNRATVAGFWKATGRDKEIRNNSKIIGMRKTLVFYTGRAPNGQKSPWIMHEYRLLELHDNSQDFTTVPGYVGAGETTNSNSEDGWVVCRVFKKKNYHHHHHHHHKAAFESSSQNSTNNNINVNGILARSDGLLITSNNPTLIETLISPPPMQASSNIINHGTALAAGLKEYDENMSDWAAFDRLLAYQLDGPQLQLYSPNTPTIQEDFWNSGPSPISSDPLCYMSAMSNWNSFF